MQALRSEPVSWPAGALEHGRGKPRLHDLSWLFPYPALVALLLAVLWFYGSALSFAFVWDDPQWFGRVVGKSWLTLLMPTADFQF